METNGAAGIEWGLEEEATFQEALAAHGDVLGRAASAAATLPSKDLSRLYPATMQDAVSLVHARIEENKRKAASKQKSKSKSGGGAASPSSHYPGAVQGGGDASAFWMYIEDYFRDVNQEDLRDLLPLVADAAADPAFMVPPSGSGRGFGEAQRKRLQEAEARRAAAEKAARLHADDATSPGSPSERRSSRLVSRVGREEDRLRRTEEALAEAEAAEAAEAAAIAAAAAARRNAMTVPQLASGQPAGSLLEVASDSSLALLLQQLGELQGLLGLEEVQAEDTETKKALAACRAAAAGGGSAANGVLPAIKPAARAKVCAWLVAQADRLAAKLGCGLKLALPASKQEAAAAGEPPATAGARAAAAPATAADGADKQQQQQQQGADVSAASAPGEQAAVAAPTVELPSAAYMHPYTKLMLEQAVPQHVIQQAVEVPAAPADGEPVRRTASTLNQDVAVAAAEPWPAGVADGHMPVSAFASPQLQGGLDRQASGAPSAATHAEQQDQQYSQQPDESLELPQAGQDPAATAGAADSIEAAGPEPADAMDPAASTPANIPAAGLTSAAGPTRTGGRNRPVANYAAMAGKRDPRRTHSAPPKKAGRPSMQQAQQQKEGGAQDTPAAAAAAAAATSGAAQHPVAQAVAAVIAEGTPDGPATARWPPMDKWGGLIAAAPGDEVLAEMLALQSELMAQVAANRARLAPAAAALLEDLPAQAAARAVRESEERDVRAWVQKQRELKRQQHRLRREQQHAEALAAKKQAVLASPRPVMGRQKGVYQLAGEDGSPTAAGAEGAGAARQGGFLHLRPEDMYDVLSERQGTEDEVYCAVCGSGDWVPENQIVMCERCDVAVHQICYDVRQIPEGDWLCWPCLKHEEALAAQGLAPAQIRPPRGQREIDDHHRIKPLEGGARSVKCALCPIKYGAFRGTAPDGAQWVHSTCALWTPECYMEGEGCNAVAGLDRIPRQRFQQACAICQQTDGAVVTCQQANCTHAFHVMCARNCGLYLTIRPDLSKKAGTVAYRIYCALHSEAQRERDEKAYEARLAQAQAQAAQRQAVQAVRESASARRSTEQRKSQALAAVERKEADKWAMNLIRANLESVRLLADRVKRREKLKRMLLQQKREALPRLLANPAGALPAAEEALAAREQEEVGVTAAAAARAAAMPPAPLPAVIAEQPQVPGLGGELQQQGLLGPAATAAAAAAGYQQPAGLGVLPGVPLDSLHQQQQAGALPGIPLVPPALLAGQQQQQLLQQRAGATLPGMQPLGPAAGLAAEVAAAAAAAASQPGSLAASPALPADAGLMPPAAAGAVPSAYQVAAYQQQQQQQQRLQVQVQVAAGSMSPRLGQVVFPAAGAAPSPAQTALPITLAAPLSLQQAVPGSRVASPAAAGMLQQPTPAAVAAAGLPQHLSPAVAAAAAAQQVAPAAALTASGRPQRSKSAAAVAAAAAAAAGGGSKRRRYEEDFSLEDDEEEEEEEEDLEEDYQPDPSAVAAALASGEMRQSKRQRAPSAKALQQQEELARREASRAARAQLQLERQRILTSNQAAQLNRELPPNLKYVPRDQLPPAAALPSPLARPGGSAGAAGRAGSGGPGRLRGKRGRSGSPSTDLT